MHQEKGEVACNACEQQRQQAVKTILRSCDNTNIIILILSLLLLFLIVHILHRVNIYARNRRNAHVKDNNRYAIAQPDKRIIITRV